MFSAIIITGKDNVGNALRDLGKGKKPCFQSIKKAEKVILEEDIPFGHKFALKPIEKGESIIKYGEVIGRAKHLIKTGEYVHIHNVESIRLKRENVKK